MIFLLILISAITSSFELAEVSDKKIVVEFNGPDLSQLIDKESNEERIFFPLGDLLISKSPEAPFLPFFELKVALNQESKFTCKIIPIEAETYKNVLLPSVPEFSNDGLNIHYNIYSNNAAPDENLLYKGEIEFINGIPAAQIFFSPYKYDPRTKTLSYVKKARIEILIFEKGEKFSLRRGWYDALYESTFLNYNGIYFNQRKQIPQNPFENGILWFQIKITGEGLYKISYKDLVKSGLPSSFPVNSIALFTRSRDTLPSSLSETNLLFKNLPIEVIDKNQNGVFDSDDEILFFSPGPKGIRQIIFGNEQSEGEVLQKVYYFSNPYTDTTSLWLTFGVPGELFQAKNIPYETEVSELFTFYHYEKDYINIAWKGLLWLGEEIYKPSTTNEASIEYDFDLSNLSHPAGFMRIRYGSNMQMTRTFRAILNSIDTLSDNSYGYTIREFFGSVNSLRQKNKLKLQILGSIPNKEDRIYVDYFTIFYKRNTNSLSDEIGIYAEPVTKIARIFIEGSVIGVFDITNPYLPIKLQINQSSNAKYISDTLTPGKIYYFASSIKKPDKIEIANNIGRLYNLDANVDYIIVTPKGFISSLLKYKSYREKNMLLYENGKWIKGTGKVELISVEDIMRDFGFGTYDPVAIRNFLKYQYEKSEGNLKFVGLYGDACYDYKNINGTSGNLVPAYEPFLSVNIDDQKGAKDDFYVDFDGDGNADIPIGRVPVRTKEQLSIFMDKLYKYENNTMFGNWRSKIIFVADDEYGESRQPSEINFHIPYANAIRADTNITPPFLEAKIIYETSYGVVGNSVDLTKRGLEAKKDFIKKFNEGSFLVTFFGHGNPVQLTHESMLLLQDLPLLNANFKNPISQFLSCKVGAFTRENPPFGIAEYMSIYNQSIGTIGSSISQYVSINFFFGREIHRILSDRFYHPLGEVILRAKMSSRDLSYYHLFGDPTTITYFPLQDSQTNIIAPDTFWIGRKNYVALHNLQTSSEYYTVFLHKPTLQTYTNPSNSNVRVSYLGENRVIYRAPFLSRGFIDTLYFFLAGTSDTGRGFCFNLLTKSNKDISANFSKNQLASLGSISTQDKSGPNIEIFVNGRKVQELAEAPLSFNLKAVLEDSSGINLFDVFANEKGIMLMVGNEFIDLTPYFEYYPSSFTKGELNYFYTANQPGKKEFKLIAYDNLNNMSQYTFTLNLKTSNEISDEILIYPNPVRNGGLAYFTFRLNEDALVKIEIFTVSGRKIFQTIETKYYKGFNEISWNLRDTYGDPVSNGLYIVKFNFRAENNFRQEIIKGIVIGK